MKERKRKKEGNLIQQKRTKMEKKMGGKQRN